MFCKCMAALHKKGRDRLEEIQTANRAETERLVGVIGEALAAARWCRRPRRAVRGDRSTSRMHGRKGTPLQNIMAIINFTSELGLHVRSHPRPAGGVGRPA